MNSKKIDDLEEILNKYGYFLGVGYEGENGGLKVYEQGEVKKRIMDWHNAEVAKAERDTRISELDWVLGRLSQQGRETTSQTLNRAIDEVDDNLAKLQKGD